MNGQIFDDYHRIFDLIYILDDLLDSEELYSKYSSETIEQFQEALLLLNKSYCFINRIESLLNKYEIESSFHSKLQYELEELSEDVIYSRR